MNSDFVENPTTKIKLEQKLIKLEPDLENENESQSAVGVSNTPTVLIKEEPAAIGVQSIHKCTKAEATRNLAFKERPKKKSRLPVLKMINDIHFHAYIPIRFNVASLSPEFYQRIEDLTKNEVFDLVDAVKYIADRHMDEYRGTNVGIGLNIFLDLEKKNAEMYASIYEGVSAAVVLAAKKNPGYFFNEQLDVPPCQKHFGIVTRQQFESLARCYKKEEQSDLQAQIGVANEMYENIRIDAETSRQVQKRLVELQKEEKRRKRKSEVEEREREEKKRKMLRSTSFSGPSNSWNGFYGGPSHSFPSSVALNFPVHPIHWHQSANLSYPQNRGTYSGQGAITGHGTIIPPHNRLAARNETPYQRYHAQNHQNRRGSRDYY